VLLKEDLGLDFGLHSIGFIYLFVYAGLYILAA